MTLEEIYKGDDVMIQGTRGDIAQARRILKQWLDGKDVDPYDAHYIGMLLLNLSQRAPDMDQA